MFSHLLKKLLASTISLAILATSMPAPAEAATAAVPECSSVSADQGSDARCAATRVGGQVVAYAKMQWTKITDVPLTVQNTSSATEVIGTSEALAFANRSAIALNQSGATETPLQAKDIASMVSMFSSNVPFIFARYNPLDGILRIDTFRVEKSMENGQYRAGLYHATFSPQHGNLWRAARAYIHPEAFKGGMTPGVNPFSSFHNYGSNNFHRISIAGAQVAVGHAMRYLGAPMSVLQIAQPRVSSYTRKSGGAFRKKVTTVIQGHARPQWLLGYAATLVSRNTSLPVANYCAPDPNRVDCALYETASSGVSFEEFNGGMLNTYETTWELERRTKSGWGFLAILVVAVIGSFLMAAIAPALGLAGGAAGAGASSGAAAGMFGNMLITNGFLSGFSSLAASIAVEAAYIAASMAIVGGANLSSMMSMTPLALLGFSKVQKGTINVGSLDKYNGMLNSRYVAPATTSDLATPSHTLLPATRNTVEGGCNSTSPLSHCGGNTGVLPKADQYIEHNSVQFIRDNGGAIMRDGHDIRN